MLWLMGCRACSSVEILQVKLQHREDEAFLFTRTVSCTICGCNVPLPKWSDCAGLTQLKLTQAKAVWELQGGLDLGGN